MAAVKPRASANKGSKKSSSKGASKLSKSASAVKSKKSSVVKPKPAQHKTKRPDKNTPKKKRVYTDKELGIQALNSIVPAGVQKANGVKKGKVFMDDRDSQMTLLNLVLAEREGNNESKMAKARQMEEIREARRRKLEEAAEQRKAGFESKKNEVKSQNKRKRSRSEPGEGIVTGGSETRAPKKKRVSFG